MLYLKLLQEQQTILFQFKNGHGICQLFLELLAVYIYVSMK